MGFSSVTGDETIMFADNASFDGTQRGGKMTTDGQLWIGSTAGRKVRLGTLTAGTGISITNGPGTITIDATGGSGTLTGIAGDAGGTATGPVVTISGGTSGAVFTRATNTITETFNFLNMVSSSSTTGYIAIAGIPILNIFGIANTFGGSGSGNTTLTTGTAIGNTGYGFQTLRALTVGTSNVALGQQALTLLQSGSYNTAIGTVALSGLLTGSRNIVINNNLSSNYVSAESDNILLGANGTNGENNTLRIGVQGSGNNQQNRAFIAGIVGVTTSNSQMVTIDSTSGQMGVATIPTGTVTSVSGTINRITSTGGATPVIDISASYVGQSSITTLGTITTGVWNGTTVAVARGGTGLTSTTANQLLYSSGANTIAGLATANSGVLTTSSSGVPSIDTTNFAVLTTGVQMKGNNTNTSPPAGFIGEQIVSTVARASPVTLSNGTTANVTSISLTAGVWDVSSIIAMAGTITGTQFTGGISTTSATLGTSGDNYVQIPTAPTGASDTNLVVPAWRILLNATTTVYMVAQGNFTVGTLIAYGRLKAVRVG